MYESYNSRRRRGWLLPDINPLWYVGVVLLIVVGVVLMTSYEHQSTRVITVCSKERVATNDGGEYRIYAAEGTFTMKDSYVGTYRTDTADQYARIKPRTSYKVTTKGWRIGLFSQFPNILKVTQLPVDRQTPGKCSDFS